MPSALFAVLAIQAAASTETLAELEPLRQSTWAGRVPDVLLCDASFSNAAVAEAMDRWRERGAELGSILRRDRCPERPNDGVIAIYADDGSLASHVLGQAIRTVWNPDAGPHGAHIRYARIWIRPHLVHHVDLLEHELGHGLGFGDTDDRSSVMSRIQTRH